MLRLSLICVILFSTCSLAVGQDIWDIPWVTVGDSTTSTKNEVVVTGNIRVKETNTPVPGASISAETFKYFDYADNNGQYALFIPPGRYRITVRHVGMKPAYVKLNIIGGGKLDITMEEGKVALEEVVVTSRPIDSNVREAVTGLNTFNVQEVRTLPTLTGEIDILKSLQLLPGVTSVGEGSSAINVRGGRSDHNLILFNDVPIFNSSHALGFISAFNQDIIRDFSLYKGNVPANFGGRAASVLEINSRRGDFDEWKISGGVSPASGRAMIEGPIIKSKTSAMLSLRSSYINWILKMTADPNVKRSSAGFFDGYAGISHRFKNNIADLSIYRSSDDFEFAKQFGFEWNQTIVNSKVTMRADKPVSPVLSLSYGRYESTLVDPSGPDGSKLMNSMNYYQGKFQVNYAGKSKHTASVGLETILYAPGDETRKPFGEESSVPRKKVQKTTGLEAAVFINDTYDLSERISISAGLRYAHYTHLGEDTVFQYADDMPRRVGSIVDTSFFKALKPIDSFGGLEPRISFRVIVFPNHSIKGGYNRMRQFIHQISNSAAPTPVDLWQVSTRYIRPQVADNFSLGYFVNLNHDAWETSVEAFYKKIDNIVEYKDFPQLYVNNHLETELLSADGKAHGLELYLRKMKGKWTGWASYTWSVTRVRASGRTAEETINDGSYFPSNYDKPHSFNLVIDRRLRKGSAISFTGTYNSGRPFTAIESSYVNEGTVVPIYSDRNRYRIPSYVRFDFSFTIGSILRKIDDSLIFSIYNLLGRENAYSIYYVRPNPNIYGPKPYRLSVLGSAFPTLTYNFRF